MIVILEVKEQPMAIVGKINIVIFLLFLIASVSLIRHWNAVQKL